MTDGAECVCVAEIKIRLGFNLVSRDASNLISSRNVRGIMQLSTTTMASRSVPSSSTIARALSGVFTRPTFRIARLPLTFTGSEAGVTSVTAAPALNSAETPDRDPEKTAATITRTRILRMNLLQTKQRPGQNQRTEQEKHYTRSTRLITIHLKAPWSDTPTQFLIARKVLR